MTEAKQTFVARQPDYNAKDTKTGVWVLPTRIAGRNYLNVSIDPEEIAALAAANPNKKVVIRLFENKPFPDAAQAPATTQ